MRHIKIFENFGYEDEINQVLQGYLCCALWIEELDSDYSVDDIDILSVDMSRDDVDKFLDELDDNDLLDELVSHMDYDSIGHDFWLTRNGHGVGFWDRGLEDLGKEVSKICEKFGNKSIYEENEKIYIE